MDDVLKPTAPEKGKPVPQMFKQWFINDRNHLNEWRKEAEEDYEFVAGRQYTSEEIAALQAQKRPPVVFNRIQPVIDSVHGQEIGNRREVRYIPREMGDAKANEILTGAAEWFRDQADAESQESDSFRDELICGVGWTETRIDFEEQRDGKPSVSRIDPLEMFWDYDAKQSNLKDKRRVWRVRRIPLGEAKAMFPNASRADLDADWTLAIDLRSENDGPIDDDTEEERSDTMVTIVQCQWIERESYHVVSDPTTGQEVELSTQEYGVANKRLKALAGIELQGVRMRRKVIKQAFFGNVVLSYGPAPCPYQFSFNAMTGKRDRNKNTWYGLVRAMKDPQRWANKWLSQMMHIMNVNSKGGLLAEKGAFENQRQAEESWSDPSAITWMADGAIMGGKVKEKAPAQFPNGFQQLTQFAISSIRDTSGVSVEMLGLREAGQAASLEMQRRQAGMTILQPFFDSLKSYRQEQGRVMLHYIREDLSDGRLVKIVGEEGAQYVPLLKQASTEYDIIVDDAPTSPNQKEAAWGILMQMLPSFGQMIPPQMMIALLEFSPLPSTIVDRLKKQAEEMQQQQAQQGEEQKQMAMQREGVELQKIGSEAERNKAVADATRSKAEVERVTSGVDLAKGLQQGLLSGLTG